MGVVALARRRIGGDGPRDLRQIRGGEFDFKRTERLGQPLARARPHQRHDIIALREDPGDGELRHGDIFRAGKIPELFDKGEILVEVLALKPRADGAKILLARTGLAPMAADEAARQHAIGCETNSQFAQGRKNVVLDAPRDQ